jgi:hypothetical protein
MCERCAKLEQAILALDAKATPYGTPIVEAGEEWARAYLIPAGPLHRALGIVGRSGTRSDLVLDEDVAYDLGFRDGYEDAVQTIDVETGGDGEFTGSTVPGGTVDVPAMQARIVARCHE